MLNVNVMYVNNCWLAIFKYCFSTEQLNVMFQPVALVVLVRVLPSRREHGVRVGGRAATPARAHAHYQATRQGQLARPPAARQR